MTTNNHPTGAEQVRWDLNFFYSGVDDPQIHKDMARWTAAARAFYADYHGTLAETLPRAIRDYAALSMLVNKPQEHLFLRKSIATSDAAVKAKIAAIQKEISAVDADCLEFFTHELVGLDDAIIAAHAASDPYVAKHLPWINRIRIFKKHLLPESIEAALTKRDPFGPDTWSEFFEEVETDLRFPWNGEEKMLTEMLHILYEDSDASVRAAALKAVNDGFDGHFAKYSAQTLYMVAGSQEVEDRERKYRHPMERRNKSNLLSDAVVEALHTVVIEKAAPLAQRFYRLKAKMLGVQTLKWSDRNAPMPFADTATISWDKAMDMVLSAYHSFSPTLARLIEDMVAEKRIDAPALPGKHSGAFNSSIVLGDGSLASFTLLNFLGSSRDVMTLAHEVGHGVHFLLAGEAQGALLWHAPSALCETASVFGEMTTFNYLKNELAEKGDRQAMLELIMDKLDDVTNTVVRQIGFSNFERRLHGWDPKSGTWQGTKKLSVEELDAFWLDTVYELYGKDGEVFTYENTSHLWSYIPHFHDPFYVYSYAFGELLTQSLYAAREHHGERFEPMYLDMLRAGGTKDAVELLKPFGLDPTSHRFWEDGIEVSMSSMVSEAESIAKELGFIA